MAGESNGQSHPDRDKYVRALYDAAAGNLETVEIMSLVNMNEATESWALSETELPHAVLVAAAFENSVLL